MRDFTTIHRRNLDALLSISGVGIFTAGSDMTVRAMNREAERLLQLDPGGGVGLTCQELLGPHVCATACAFRQTLVDRQPRREFSIRIRTRAGENRDLVFSTAFLETPEGEDDEVAIALRDVTEAEQIRRAITDRWHFHDLVCASGKMKEIVSLVRELAPFDSTVLILGESGTGKELIARAVHAESPRKDQPFVTVNCSAYGEGVLESELFGHARGSFTGALQDRVGRFQAADGGTVFLDEIGEIPLSIQVKLLRVLQEHVIERVGEQRAHPVDIRVVAATNRDIKTEVRRGRFREDLYYRLNVITVDLPPLRARREDIPALIDYFVEKHAERTGKTVTGVQEEALGALLRHDWPGNVRELENAVEHAIIRAQGPVLRLRNFPPHLACPAGVGYTHSDIETRIDAALAAAGGRVGQAAGILGVHRTTVWRHLKKQRRLP